VLGLDAKTAGQVLGKRPGAVRTAAHRGLQRLAERLATTPVTSENRARVTFLAAATVKEAR